ncbi:MAG: AraC family transcriptional regulator, partial [Bacteroidota bacterium]
MQVLEANKPFEIQEIELSRWEQRPVKNNFFELVIVKSGKGTQCINYNFHDYQSGSVFLLPPLKCHSFQIETTTRFVFVKFTSNLFIGAKKPAADEHGWFKDAAYILSNYNQQPGDIIISALDRQHIHALAEVILNENRTVQPSSFTLVKNVMMAILEIVLRNIKQSATYEVAVHAEKDRRITELLTYINEHLHEPDLLKVEQLARVFAISPTYLGEFFRKKVKVSLREYIIKAKLRLVEIRLLNSDFTLTEIADELGFTDASHLSKTYKKYTGLSIREFRQRGEYQILKRST